MTFGSFLVQSWKERAPHGIWDRLQSTAQAGGQAVKELFSPVSGRKRKAESAHPPDDEGGGWRSSGKRAALDAAAEDKDALSDMPARGGPGAGGHPTPERQTSGVVGMAVGATFGEPRGTAISPIVPRGLGSSFASPTASPPSGGRPATTSPASADARPAAPLSDYGRMLTPPGSAPRHTPPRIHGAHMGSHRFTSLEAAPYDNGVVSTSRRPTARPSPPQPPAEDGDEFYAQRYPPEMRPTFLAGLRYGRQLEQQRLGASPGGGSFKDPVDITDDLDGFKEMAAGGRRAPDPDAPEAAPTPPAGTPDGGTPPPAPLAGAAGGQGTPDGGGVEKAATEEEPPSAHLREVAARDADASSHDRAFQDRLRRTQEIIEAIDLDGDAVKARYQDLERQELEARNAAISASRGELKELMAATTGGEAAAEEGESSLESMPLAEADEVGAEWADDPGLRPLTAEQEGVVDRVLSAAGPDGEELVDDPHTGIIITRGDMRKLLPGEWLNDEVVNVYMGLLQQRNTRRMAERGEARMHFFTTFFYAKLTQAGAASHKAVRRWTTPKKLGGYKLMDCDKVFCPINHGNTHWTQAVINLRDRRFEFYDSMAGGGSGVTVLKNLETYIQDEWADKAGERLDTSEWEHVIFPAGAIPQQKNCHDCGVFSSKFADYVSRDAPTTFSQADMPYFRRRLAAEIAALRAE